MKIEMPTIPEHQRAKFEEATRQKDEFEAFFVQWCDKYKLPEHTYYVTWSVVTTFLALRDAQ